MTQSYLFSKKSRKGIHPELSPRISQSQLIGTTGFITESYLCGSDPYVYIIPIPVALRPLSHNFPLSPQLVLDSETDVERGLRRYVTDTSFGSHSPRRTGLLLRSILETVTGTNLDLLVCILKPDLRLRVLRFYLVTVKGV